MELNADFSQRIVVHAAQAPWVASPMPGVERRMLDRIGEEVARATSIVRYARGSHFSAHTHGGGEEFFVLEGVFQDEHGDYPVGSYVRNPPTSSHIPRSDVGCVIFVKLWQFAPEDRTRVRIDTATMPFLPAQARRGVELMPLFRDSRERVSLERWASNAEVVLVADGGIEILVLDGEFTDDVERFVPMSWLRLPPGSTLRGRAGKVGCRSWIKSGHLSSHSSATAKPSQERGVSAGLHG
jgi:hypothetical protein